MNRKVLIFLLLICIFIAGCDNVAEQISKMPGVSDEVVSLAENISDDPDLLHKVDDTIIESFVNSYIDQNIEGKGTIDNPYLIYELADLLVLQSSMALDKNYRLMKDITLPETEDGKSNWSPVGSADDPFTGSFDGNGHKIEGLKISLVDFEEGLYTISLGLFGAISGADAGIKNLSLTDFEIIVDESAEISVTAGSLVGWLKDNATVEDCFVSGIITIANSISRNIGGIVGHNRTGKILDCSASVEITCKQSVSCTGGIVGYNDGIVSNCSAKFLIESASQGIIGGIAGENHEEILSCYTIGEISGSNTVGGIVGYNYIAYVKNCSAFVDISSYGIAGGIAGKNYEAALENCYALGSISAFEAAGGICGSYYYYYSRYANSTYIKSCFALQEKISSSNEVGRIVGSYQAGVLHSNFAWSGTTVVKNNDQIFSFKNENLLDGITVSISDLVSKQFYQRVSWSIGEDDSDWGISDHFLLPVLNNTKSEWILSYDTSYLNSSNESLFFVSFDALEGLGTKSDPYLIYNIEDLNRVREYSTYFQGVHYKLMNDIVLDKVKYGESNWVPIGTVDNLFNGVFDGNNKTISGIVMYDETDKEALGFFGFVDKGSEILNLNLVDLKISYNPTIDAVVGGIASYNAGSIENCSTSGKIAPSTLVVADLEKVIEDNEFWESYWEISSAAGGIVGLNVGNISKCYSTVDITITASGYFGGIAALNNLTIKQCHFSGSISHLFFNDPIHVFMTYIGGISGYNDYIIKDCYSTATINSQGIVGGAVGYNCFSDFELLEIGLDEYHIVPTADGGYKIIFIDSTSDYKKTSVVSNCYVISESLFGSYACGGIVGYNSGGIDSCMALPEYIGSFMNLGLLVGFSEDYEDVTNNYTSNGFALDPNSPDLDTSTKRTTLSRLKQKSFYQSLNWDFDDIWEMKIGYGFPVLKGVGGQGNLKTPDSLK